jgi:hypothetical protein
MLGRLAYTAAHLVPTLIEKTPGIGPFWRELENRSLAGRLAGGEGGI